eukprot:CAMPEP_0198144878 /NCGR_PEP_ID=MMETSP1443-20131203/19171_1 /TAXON_ID=186043 /ORGANISM="Entomoneis sp., Strain CCMP2396" /LENGTH=285 /DNA_ID=CAMNT_0043808363 /DNA_START=164 /DNA_END=1021 /DNA_ORIENTATION=-
MTRLDHIPTRLVNLPSEMPRNVTFRKEKSLPATYQPGEFDVCCGRGKRHWNAVGNVRFRKIIQSSVERYMDAPSKNDKTAVVVSIVDDIRHFGGNFLKEDLIGSWYDIGDPQAREKVGHSLRDQVSTIHRHRRKEKAMQALAHQKQSRMDISNDPNGIISESKPQQPDDPTEQDDEEEDDNEDVQSDGENERDSRRNTLSSSMIIDKFTRRPSFASAVADPSNSLNSSGRVRSSGARSLSVRSSVRESNLSSGRSAGWSFLNELDFNLDQFDDCDANNFEPLDWS